jgi:signal transduction histidine kinase
VDYRDDGNGMAAEAQARIFDPFFTTDLQQGMGLGMHLVYNLITHRMGGSILCESTPGQGVHFHIEIPL